MEIDRKLYQLAQAERGLVLRRSALSAGISSSSLDRRQGSGLLVIEQPGVYRHAAVPPSWDLRVRAAVRATASEGVASHRASARRQGLVNPDDDAVDLTVSAGRQPRLYGVSVHRSLDLHPHHVREIDGVPFTTIERTLADLGDVLPPHRVAWAFERAISERLTTVAKVAAILDEIGGRGRNGRGPLRAVLEGWSADDRPPDSVLEARFMRLIREHGLPAPVFQFEIRDRGMFVARVDAAWPDRMIVGEVDGLHAHNTADLLQHDLTRQNRLVALGYTVLRWTWNDVTRQPWVVVRDLTAALKTARSTCE